MEKTVDPNEYRYPKNLGELYELFRVKFTHEDDLVNHRLTWLLQCEALLIAAVGFGYKYEDVKRDKFLQYAIKSIFSLGILTSACIFITVIAAMVAMQAIIKQFEKCIRDFEKEHHITHLNKYSIRIDVFPKTTKFGISGAIMLPLIFIAFWIILLFLFPCK